MLFMIIERFKGRDPAPIYERVREQGRALPDGLRYIDSWVEGELRPLFSGNGVRRCVTDSAMGVRVGATSPNSRSCPSAHPGRFGGSFRRPRIRTCDELEGRRMKDESNQSPPRSRSTRRAANLRDCGQRRRAKNAVVPEVIG